MQWILVDYATSETEHQDTFKITKLTKLQLNKINVLGAKFGRNPFFEVFIW